MEKQPKYEKQQKLIEEPRILLLRLSSLGDVVLTLPLLKALRLEYPNARIDFVVRKEYADVLRSCSEITNLIELDVSLGRQGLLALRTELNEVHYSHVLDLHNNFRTQALRRSLRTKTSTIDKRSLQRWLLVRFKINLLKDAPDIIGRYFETAKFLGIEDRGAAPELENQFVRDPELVAIAPGSRHWNKRWPTEYFVALTKKVIAEGYRVELYGSVAEKSLADTIVHSVASDRVVSFAGSLSILETMERMSSASLAITNDSGLMHVATAVGLPTISIFGPTVREFGFFPRSKSAIVLETEGLYCRPCTAIGRDDCPEKHFRCMREITPEQVYQIAAKSPTR